MDKTKNNRPGNDRNSTSLTSRKTPRRPKSNYSLRQKLEVLRILKINDFNLAKTAKETGINLWSIRRWRIAHPEVFCHTPIHIKQLEGNIEMNIVQRNKKFVEKNYNKWEQICEKLFQQLFTVIETETDVEKMAKTLRIMREIMIPKDYTNPTGKSNIGNASINVLQFELEKLSQLPDLGY